VFRRRRPTDPWFDAECRAAKRLTRRLERAYPIIILSTSRCRRRDGCQESRGTINAGLIASCASRSAVISGPRKSKLRGLIWRSCGDQWISYSVVTASQCRRPLTSRLLISSPTKLPTCAYLPTTRRHHAAAGLTLNEFGKLSVDDVTSSDRQIPDKSSAVDPIPTFVLKQTIDLLAPFVAELFNRSLAAGHFSWPV